MKLFLLQWLYSTDRNEKIIMNGEYIRIWI